MTPKELKIKTVEKSDYRVYLKKAADFHDIMLKALDSANWTAAGLNAVHCAISCCDALSNLSGRCDLFGVIFPYQVLLFLRVRVVIRLRFILRTVCMPGLHPGRTVVRLS